MRVSRDKLTKRMEEFRAALKRAGLKITPQRLAVFARLAEEDSHPGARAIHGKLKKKMPGLSLDTVYRTLWLFVDLGIVENMGEIDGVRFDANTEPHHHFICRKCGASFDIYCRDFDDLKLPGELSEIGGAMKAMVEVRGICRKCLSRKRF